MKWYALFGVAALAGCAAIVENDPAGLFATINGLPWIAPFLWIVAVAVQMIRSDA